MPDLFRSEKTEPAKNRPLADRLRPELLEEVAGQEHLVGPDGPLRRMVDGGHLSSLILWGPPGCGKTTLARILAKHTDLHFEQLSAIFSGVGDLRKVFDSARLRAQNGKGTLLFVDEIHRFNKSQQDAFLPVMEDGTIILIGATTENPSFELNAALLSRAQVFVLKRLEEPALEQLLQKAESEAGKKLPVTEDARALMKTMADGDGRYLLSWRNRYWRRKANWTPKRFSKSSSAARPFTIKVMTRTTTCSRPSTNPCADRMSMPRSTGWRA
jgi:putative ATPase